MFGAGGRAGRAAVGEALRRGHEVMAVVRDPATVVAGADMAPGDVTDPGAIAHLTTGHDAVIMTAYATPPETFFPAAAKALIDGLSRSGVPRLIVVGLAATLRTAGGTRLMDAPGFPPEYRPLCLGHAAMATGLRASALDWLIVSPAGDFDPTAPRTGRYSITAADPAGRISYTDLAVALLDEIDTPHHHRTHIGVEAA
ncbi:NAD(P)-dependent oxidoreductase [Nonomuraea salmonea]